MVDQVLDYRAVWAEGVPEVSPAGDAREVMAHPAAQGAKLDRVVRVAMADQAVQEVKSDRVARVATADPEGPAVIPELVVKADRVALVGIQDPDSSSVQSCSSSCHLSSHLISILESKKRYSIWSFHACISSNHSITCSDWQCQ